MSELSSTYERRIRKEAKLLAREARKGARSSSYKISGELKTEIETRAQKLEATLESSNVEDRGKLRVQLVELDELVDRHLAFSRKSTGREYAESIGIAVVIALLLRAFVVEAFKIPSSSMIPTLEIGDHIFVNKFIYGVRLPYTTTRFFEFRKPARGEVVVFIYPCDPDKDFIKRIVALEGDSVEVRCDRIYINGKELSSVQQNEECTYWDASDNLEWDQKECSLYKETNGGATYTTVFENRDSRNRPAMDKRRSTALKEDYPELSGHLDFPGHSLPSCRDSQDGENRSLDERTAARGEIVELEAPNGVCDQRRQFIVPKGHFFAMGDNRDNSSDSRVWGPAPLKNIKGKALFIWWSKQPGTAGGYRMDRMGRIVD